VIREVIIKAATQFAQTVAEEAVDEIIKAVELTCADGWFDDWEAERKREEEARRRDNFNRGERKALELLQRFGKSAVAFSTYKRTRARRRVR